MNKDVRFNKEPNIKHPIQPLYKDQHGTIRFKENEIVRYLLDNGGIDLNALACIPFDQNEREQFAQLIGYSLSGFSELQYVSDETYAEAEVERLEAELERIKEAATVEALERVIYHETGHHLNEREDSRSVAKAVRKQMGLGD